MINSCFYIFANEIILLSSIKSIISTVETDKNRKICRFLDGRKIRIRGYDMVLLELILNLTILQWGDAAFYPRLCILAKKYLAIPASYVPSERVFSLAGH